MAPYLPQDRVAPSPYSEGGALYALGLIHANHGQDIRQFILQCLRDTAEEVFCTTPRFQNQHCDLLPTPMMQLVSIRVDKASRGRKIRLHVRYSKKQVHIFFLLSAEDM